MFFLKSHNIAQYEVILFDLDDTLYPRAAGVMDAIAERIMLFMVQRVKIPPDDVMTQRFQYYQRYGTALRGLMEEHNINPREFLDFVHDVRLADYLRPSPPLESMLQTIRLRKIIFTNADVPHSERVLDALGVRHHFERIIDIRAINYKSKPDPVAYQRALSLLGVSGKQCIMVEDSPRNLLPAKDMGMTTILVDGTSKSSAIDFVVPTVFHVGEVLANILPREGA